MAKHGRGVRRLLQQNLCNAKILYPDLSKQQLSVLSDLTATHHLSIFRGELLYFGGKWYVSHSGLLRIAHRRRCVGIDTRIDTQQTEASANRWVFRATVHKSPSERFVGYGDADPSNVSPLVRGAEMRVAETRAVNRALRKAYGIGIRFPQNGCLSCAFLGLCLNNQQLRDSKLNRCPGAKDLAWLDELHY